MIGIFWVTPVSDVPSPEVTERLCGLSPSVLIVRPNLYLDKMSINLNNHVNSTITMSWENSAIFDLCAWPNFRDH